MIIPKIIFLDFDGVLNNTGSYLYSKNEKWPANPDPVSVFLIQRLIEKYDFKVVVSSTWKQKRTVDELESILINDFGFTCKNFVIDKTPDIYDLHLDEYLLNIRGSEIEAWLKRHPEFSTSYVIIDDSVDFYSHQRNYIVQTDPDDGFRFTHYMKVLKIFNINEGIII